MSEHRAFLNAILERPDDDLPRLVYADYLDETNDPDRAEFIRVQIELATLDADDPRSAWLEQREQELQKDRVEWRLPIRGIQRFHRGFVESMATTAEWLIGADQPVLQLAPIRELRVINADNFIPDFANVPGLDRIESLDLRNNSFGTRDRLARFLELAPLRKMTRLLLLNNQIWSDEVEVLVGSERAAQLHSLDLSGNAIGNAGVAVLARAENLSGLRTLVLRSDELEWRDRILFEGVETLAASRTLNELRTLDLSSHLIGEDGIAALANATGLQKLERVGASFNRLGTGDDPDFISFLNAPVRESMQVWNLAGSTISGRAAEGFAVWDQLETLTELNLEQCEWAAGARELLAERPWAYKIRLGDPVSGEQA